MLEAIRAALRGTADVIGLSVRAADGTLTEVVSAPEGRRPSNAASLHELSMRAMEPSFVLVPCSEPTTFAVLPLVCDGETIGALEVVTSDALTETHRRMLGACADMCAVIVRRFVSRPAASATAKTPSPEPGDLSLLWAAHELRSPLVVALTALDHVLSCPGEVKAEGRALVARCTDELRRLAETTDELLAWGSGDRTPHPRPVDLASLVSDPVGANGAGSRVNVSVRRPLTVFGDPTQLRSAIGNLVNNALAYSDGEVAVILERDGDWAQITVRDTGPGIPEDQQAEIFRFGVRGSSGVKDAGGRGLGLYIARRVIEAHGGRIAVHSGDRGAVFRIRLPLAEGD